MTGTDARARLDAALTDARSEIAGAQDAADLAAVERRFLGKRSIVREVNEAIKELPASKRPAVGEAVGAYRAAVAELVESRRAELRAAASSSIDGERLDLTLGGHARPRGHLHLVTQVQRELEDIFVGMGYTVTEGPEVEDD